MSEGWHIAVLGATDVTGIALIELLEERHFPIAQLYPLVDSKRAGESVNFSGQAVLVLDAESFDWSQATLAFFVASEAESIRYAEIAANAGCLVVDSSGLFALEPDVPLVVPNVNSQVLADYRNRNIIAVASSQVCQLLVAVNPLAEVSALSRLHVTHFLPASSYGELAVTELANQGARLLNGLPIEQGIFKKQLAFNLLPLLSDTSGSVKEERQLVDQTRKILQDYGLPISVSCLQSPVFYGHAQIIHVENLYPLDAIQVQQQLEHVDLIQLSEENDYPTQVDDAAGNTWLSIGCIRNDYGTPEVVQFWSVADGTHFGTALMAVMTAELLLKEYLY